MSRKPRTPQPQTPGKVQERDLFQTPNYATQLLVPYIPVGYKNILEPSAGEGKIASVLEVYGYNVYQSDIRPGNNKAVISNFITEDIDIYHEGINCFITNPPYSIVNKFIKKAISYDIPFAFLIAFNMGVFLAECFRKYGCQGIVPDHRIDYITPTGLSGANGHTSYFHSFWLTRYFNLPEMLVFVELTKSMKENI